MKNFGKHMVLCAALMVCAGCGQEHGQLDFQQDRPVEESFSQLPADTIPTMEDVERFIAEGNDIAAIKAYRRIHGVGLADAKAAVDAMKQKGPEPEVSSPD